jgi:hypothetical protein
LPMYTSWSGSYRNSSLRKKPLLTDDPRCGLLTQTSEPARAILEVETIDVVADRGYFKIEDIEACEKAGMSAPYRSRFSRSASVFSLWP